MVAFRGTRLLYRKTARNFAPVTATAARLVEVSENRSS
jgi:acyl CoA:acetate/3-ketoacid CoA transferase alpha subunit